MFEKHLWKSDILSKEAGHRYIPPWLQKSVKFIVLRLLANTLWFKKLNLFVFTQTPKQNSPPRFLSLSPRQKEITHSSQAAFSEDLFFPQQLKKFENLEMKKLTKWNLRGYWSQVLINLTIFATCTFLFFFLCHNFSFKHVEVWRFLNLTNKIFAKKYSVQE